MKEAKCSCQSLERLEGASVPAYIAAFLEQKKDATPEEKNLYRCKMCGRIWEKRAPEMKTTGTRPSLIRIG
jgi:rubrerythrin